MNNPRPVKTPSRVVVRVDGDGITASNGRAEIRYAVSSASAGFNPLELQSAALAMCTAITIRNELRALGGDAGSAAFEVVAEGVKAPDAPSRLGCINVDVALPALVPAAQRTDLIARAEQACTIANTLHAGAEIATSAGE